MCHWWREPLNAGILLHRLTLSLHITLKPWLDWRDWSWDEWECWGEEIIIVFLFSHFIPLLAISLHIHPCTNTTSLSTVFIQHMLSEYEEPQRFVFVFLVSDNVSNDVSYSWAQHEGQWHSKLTESCRPCLQQQLHRGQINTACRNGPNISMITPVLLPTNAGSLCAGRDAVYRGAV